MAVPIDPIPFRDFSRGVIRGVSPFISPQNSVKHAINFLFDEEIGEAVLRQGSTIVNAQIVGESNNILGMHNFRDRDNGNHALLAAVNEVGDGSSSIYDATNGNQSLSGLTAGLTFRFETYLGEAVFENGTDSPRSWTGSGAWRTSGGPLDIEDMPIGVDVINYKDRLHVLTASGILRRSSLPTSPNFSSISWTSGNDSIAVDPDSSAYTGNGIGLARVSGLLLIFKERALYTFNGSSIQPDFLYDVGSSSAHSIATGGGLTFFFNADGIWMTRGGEPIRISRPVQAYIDGMSSSVYASVAGFADGRHYWCSIGDSTVDGTTYSNVVLRYSIATKEWAVFSYANRPTAFSRYINGTDVTVAYGDTTARAYTLDSGLTDNGTAIQFQLETHDLEFGSRGTEKEIHDKVMVYSENAPEAIVQLRIDNGDWITLGTAREIVEELQFSDTLKGHFFNLRVVGVSTTQGIRFKGFEFPRVTHLSYAR